MSFITRKVSDKYETYKQENYVYSYIRAKNGYGKECSIISFPIEYEASVTYGLTFMDQWFHVTPQWLAKDLIVLFYRDSFGGKKEPIADGQRKGQIYSYYVGEFLKYYYMGHERQESNENIKAILDDDKVIHSRCGYLRQGYPFIFKDFEVNKLLVHLEGTNGKLSDIDLYDGVKSVI